MKSDPTLDTIGVRLGTDKSSRHHNYLSAYEEFLLPWRSLPIKLLEIGVLDGASLAMWTEYFPLATIVGADINPAVRKFERDRVKIEILDQSDVGRLQELVERYGPFDVIIEDGSHIWEHQIIGIVALFPHLQPGGVYVAEDLHTSYGHLAQSYRRDAHLSCMDFLKSTLDVLVGDGDGVHPVAPTIVGLVTDLQSVTFIHRACIMRKRSHKPSVLRTIGEPLIGRTSIRTLPVRILLHLSDKGDVSGPDGYVNFNGDEHQAEGLAIDSDDVPLEARVRLSDGTWTLWSPAHNFIGSRGAARRLTGVSVRVASHETRGLGVHVYGRFAGQRRIVEAVDGEECFSQVGGALCGLQVVLRTTSSHAD